MFVLLAACAEEQEPYPFDKIRGPGTEDTADTADTDPGDTDTALTPDDPDAARLVTVAFEGEVATVSGAPLGFDAGVRLARVTGTLTWNLSVADRSDDPQRGQYDHAGSGGFTLLLEGRTIRGSGWPRLEVEDFGSDTFRYVDGAELTFDEHERPMTVDGEEDLSLGLWTAFTDASGAAFADDALPDAWPFAAGVDLPHTFSLSDGGGTLLLQLDAIAAG